ncbi:MAG: site-2 protease family protein [Clostridia bacterium]|nr:site-2 protease family protein [Clostridia bacterium]
MNNVIYYILSALAALIALTVHEYCHGYAAYRLGDDTAKNMGRLTLNPIKHLDPYGTLCMILFHVGWAKPVPVNSRNFKDPKKGFAITAAAGPISNIILAFVSALVYLLVFACVRDIPFAKKDFTYYFIENLLLFIFIFHSVNIGLGLFNLLPIPPFDGSRLLYVILPPKAYFAVMKYERKIYYGVLVWLLLGEYAAMGVRMLPFVANSPILYWLAGIFSLSGMLGTAISWVSQLMLGFWQLIPFLKL